MQFTSKKVPVEECFGVLGSLQFVCGYVAMVRTEFLICYSSFVQFHTFVS